MPSGGVGGSAIDHHDCLLPEKIHRALSTWVSLRLLALGDNPRGHQVFHHGATFELVFDGVHVVQTSRFKKFLYMVFQLPRLVLEIVLSGRDMPLVEVVHFLVIVVAVGSGCVPSGGGGFCHLLPPLVPLLVALNGATWLLPVTIFPSPRTMTVPTASSPEVCRVVILSSSLVVFN
jgi:hypothetical protein